MATEVPELSNATVSLSEPGPHLRELAIAILDSKSTSKLTCCLLSEHGRGCNCTILLLLVFLFSLLQFWCLLRREVAFSFRKHNRVGRRCLYRYLFPCESCFGLFSPGGNKKHIAKIYSLLYFIHTTERVYDKIKRKKERKKAFKFGNISTMR